ncbi:winged helix-turn-helix domain-containing protein [Colwelliaceae bacterium 6441]
MLWAFGKFEFNANTRVLSSADEEVLLEPKIASLLCYFCLNPQQNITRDMLFTEVWHGQLVSENAINRVVGLLRKALSDEGKVKQYIVTVPKIGYRFIADASLLVEKQALNTPSRTQTPSSNEAKNDIETSSECLERADSSTLGRIADTKVPLLLLAFIMLLFLAYLLSFRLNSPDNTNPNVSPLTRLSSDQFDAAMANNGKQLLYSSYENKQQALYLMTLPDGTPERISLAGGRASAAQWAHDDSQVVYLYRNKAVCEFHQIDFIGGKAQEPRVIYRCLQNSFTDFAFSKDNQTLYFVERANTFEPFYLYQLNIATGDKQLLPQPKAIGKGNHHFDYDFVANKLLILSDQTAGKTSFFQLDLSNSELTELINFDYFIDSAVWSHKENAIVHQGPHPAYQLLQTNLANKQSSVLVSDTRRINDVKRINNQRDYLFSSYLFNSDIETNVNIMTDVNSSVSDFLPAISHNQIQLAFISKRSGYSKIWIKNVISDKLTSIEPPDQGRSFYSLHWSFDDKTLLVNTSKGILLFDVKMKKVLNTLNLSLPAYGVSWLDKNKVVYSQYVDKKWQLFSYELSSKITNQLNTQWAFALGNEKHKIFIQNDFQIFIDGKLAPEQLTCQDPVFRHSLTMRLDNDDFYCLAKDNASELLKLSSMKTMQRQAHKMPSMGYYDYAVTGEMQALSKTKSADSDIIRTNF